MELHGKNIIGGKISAMGKETFTGVNASTGENLQPTFHQATQAEVNEALATAAKAFEDYRRLPAEKIASFLERIAEEIMKLGDELIQRASQETALPEARLIGERARTVGQMKMFAEVVREGSWVEASIDKALPDRKPLPKPDLRRMLIPLGPVIVFGASNFPLAYSVAGGDTASALASGNPVIVKAHPAHPGTSEMVARAIVAAAEATGMPAGVFSMVHGLSYEISLELVKHPAAKAVGFTGSLSGGRALFNAAAARPEPIPVYAEMGSTNPVFVLPGALKKSGVTIAEGLVQSVTVGVGQFCTNPGLVFGLRDEQLKLFAEKLGELASTVTPGTMLHKGILEKFQKGSEKVTQTAHVRVLGESATEQDGRASAMVFATDAKSFLSQEVLREELFGPSTLLVESDSVEQMEEVARNMPGQLTATVHGTEVDLTQYGNLIAILQQKVGRLVFNGFPTGVEVCPSMQHGGPYPATTDVRSTSVGTQAIKRFARPICFQNFPEVALPVELKNKNVRNMWRLIDNQWTKADV
nr:aldehyde dehydrogenase (NADP(+)) [Pedosphaera parvula]